MAQLMTNIFWSDHDTKDPNFGMQPYIWAIGLGVFLFPFVLMKELAELKLVSVALFCSAMIFVVINVI